MNKCCENCFYYKSDSLRREGICKNSMSRNYNNPVRADEKCIYFIDKKYCK